MTHVTCKLTAKNQDSSGTLRWVIEYVLPLPFKFMVKLCLNVEKWVKFHVHTTHAADLWLFCENITQTLPVPVPQQWLWQFYASISTLVIFCRGCFNLYITLGNGSEKCYIVLHRVGVWSEKKRFLRYRICERLISHQSPQNKPVLHGLP